MFDPKEHEGTLLLMVRKYVETHCSCGHQGSTLTAHETTCRLRLEAERYAAHSVVRVESRGAEAAARLTSLKERMAKARAEQEALNQEMDQAHADSEAAKAAAPAPAAPSGTVPAPAA